MPGLPQPAFVPDATLKSDGAGASKQAIGKSAEPQTSTEEQGRDGSSKGSKGPVGPWDRSRSFREGETSVGGVIRPPAIAASVPRVQ